jgi:Kef-type K+ transport system membrane component KefB/nucleotide-binding universal stress UspA family protein
MSANFALLVIAALGAIAIVVSNWARRFIPEIVVFLALGVAIGQDGLGLINDSNIRSLNLLTQVALAAIIFRIGERLRWEDLRGNKHSLFPMNAAQILLSSALVFLATRWVGADPRVAIILALIAAETGVLTVTATISEERAEGTFTRSLLSSVAITNVVVAGLFGLAFPFVLALSGQTSDWTQTLQVFGQIVVGSVLIGLAGGWLLRAFTPAMETSGELLLFLLVVLTGMVGADIAIEASVVVSALVAGLFVANTAPWLAERLFAAVRTLEAPIYLVFFVVAGASIHLDELAAAGVLGLTYLVSRTVGKVAGAALGTLGSRGDMSPRDGLLTGLGLLPHAGMAIALVAFTVELSDFGQEVSAVVLGSIVVFELAGPLLMRRVLRDSGEAGQLATGGEEVLPSLAVTRQFRKILVPIGSTQVLLPRLPFMLDLVGNIGARLVAVHVSRPGSETDADKAPEVLELVERVAAERNIPCTAVHRVSEQVAQSLIDVAAEQEVDLIIMGEPARTSLLEPSRWGMVAQKVVRDVEVPVLVYPVDPSRPERVPQAYLRRAARADAAAGERAQREDRVREQDAEAAASDLGHGAEDDLQQIASAEGGSAPR